MSAEGNQRMARHFELLQALHAAEVSQIDDKRRADNAASRSLHEFCRGLGRAARGDQIVDDEYARSVSNGVRVNLDDIDTVLTLVSIDAAAGAISTVTSSPLLPASVRANWVATRTASAMPLCSALGMSTTKNPL